MNTIFELSKDIIVAYDEYTQLLEEEINKNMGILIARGYSGSEVAYQKGCELRDTIKKLKNEIEQAGEEEDSEEQIKKIGAMFAEFELLTMKRNLTTLLNESDIEILSYFIYPSVVTNRLLRTDRNGKTEEHDWLQDFTEKMFAKMKEYNLMIDNKIAIEFRPIPKKGNKPQSSSTLFFGSKDGEYCIGLQAMNKDGLPSIKNLKKKV